MDPQRKQLIITEIIHWKENKMLPEHYCDFLITLYAQGEVDEEIQASKAIFLKEKRRLNLTIIMFTIIALTVSGSMFVFVQYPALTFTLTTMVLLVFLLLTLRKSFHFSVVAPLLWILASFILLLMSLKLWIVFWGDQLVLLIVLLILNCTLWLFGGRILKLAYFTISGAVGLLLIIGFIVTLL